MTRYSRNKGPSMHTKNTTREDYTDTVHTACGSVGHVVGSLLQQLLTSSYIVDCGKKGQQYHTVSDADEEYFKCS